jgi:hypothetical protein
MAEAFHTSTFTLPIYTNQQTKLQVLSGFSSQQPSPCVKLGASKDASVLILSNNVQDQLQWSTLHAAGERLLRASRGNIPQPQEWKDIAASACLYVVLNFSSIVGALILAIKELGIARKHVQGRTGPRGKTARQREILPART